MALITRLSRLFRADMHAVLDRIEEPDLLLRQAIREMEEELGRDERRVQLLNHEQEQLAARVQAIDQSLQEMEQELDACFAADKDELARAVVRRRLETQRLGNLLTRKREESAKGLARLQRRAVEHRAQLEALRQKAELLGEPESHGERENHGAGPDFSVREDEVEVAFLRERQRRRPS